MEKTCSKCKEVKPICCFGRHGRDGYRSRCKACVKQDKTAYYLKNPDKRALHKCRTPEAARRNVAAWGQRYPEKVRAKRAIRRLAQRQACPPWADKQAIANVYAEAVRLSSEMGIPFEVDHIIPIRGENVCGLHVHWNLRAIPAADNHRKGNRIDG